MPRGDPIDISLSSFLDERRAHGDVFTHTSFFPKRKYEIRDEEDVAEFRRLYCENLASASGEAVGLTEMPEQNGFGPLREDFDIKLPLECGIKKHHYTDKDIETIVHAYQNILSNVIDSSSYEDKLLYCVVLEKKKPRVEEGVIKDGFHLHFPHFWCSSFVKDVYVRNKIKEFIVSDPELEAFRENVVSKIIDTKVRKMTIEQQADRLVDQCAKKAWLMYGSRKNEKAEFWKVTTCYNENLEKVSLNVIFADELVEIAETEEIESKRLAIYNLPTLLSIRLDKPSTPLIPAVASFVAEQLTNLRKRKFEIKKVRSEEESLADLKTIEDGNIMEMLDDRRAEDRNLWMEVGWTLFNIGQGAEKALDMWIEFSQRSEIFKDGECEKEWSKMKMGGRTIASLLFMAKNDNPDRFMTWKNDQIETHIKDVLMKDKATHYGIAKIIYHMYKNRFVCASSKFDLWYEFYNHRWHLVDNGVNIMKLIPTEIVQKFWDLRNQIKAKREAGNGTEKDKDDLKKILKVITTLEDEGFCTKTVKMCKVLFYDGNFLKRMDENRDLIGFENGVYDLKMGMFRDGSPDDYITFSTGRSYIEYSYQDCDVVELMEYLGKVYVDVELLDYFLDFVCSCFQGGNRNKIFAVFTGAGDAGKTSICKLLEFVFGEYCINFPRETFIVGRASSAGGARPDLARVRGKRIAFVKELSKREKLHIGMVKEMTGNDSFFARTIYEKGTDINPMFKLILFCNDPPEIPGHDAPMWERLQVLPHESCFPKPDDPDRPVPEDLEEQYAKKTFTQDANIAEKLPDFAGPLTWVLLDRFKNTYLEYGIRVPKKVRASTREYKVKNDIYLSFQRAKLCKADDSNFLRAVELYRIFNNWYTVEYPSYAKTEKIGPQTFKEEMSKRLSCVLDAKRVGWHGWTLKSDKLDVDSDEASSEGENEGDDLQDEGDNEGDDEEGDQSEKEDEGVDEGDTISIGGAASDEEITLSVRKRIAKSEDEESTFDLDDD